jgi:Arc/MetJ-type ribon-helix-helix transcriptional regulator
MRKDVAPIRKTLTLPLQVWQQIDQIRREAHGSVPSESAVVRDLIREALEARVSAPRRPR